MSVLDRVLHRNHRPADYEIVTPLTIDEVRRRLSGKERLGRLFDNFSRPLGLDGMVGTNFLTIELDRARVRGSFENSGGGSIIRIWQTAHRGWWIDRILVEIGILILLGLVFRIVFEFDMSALLFVALTFGLVTARSWRHHRRCRNSWIPADDAAQIIANLVIATEAHKIHDGVLEPLPLATHSW